MCVCVKKRNGERDGDRERSIGNERVCMRVSWWVGVRMGVRVCVREKDNERETMCKCAERGSCIMCAFLCVFERGLKEGVNWKADM